MQSQLTLFYIIIYYSFTVLFSVLFSRVLLYLTNNLVIWEFPPNFLYELLVLASCHMFDYFTPLDLVCLVIFGKYPGQIIKQQIVWPCFLVFLLVGQAQNCTEFEYLYLWQRNYQFHDTEATAHVFYCGKHLCISLVRWRYKYCKKDAVSFAQ